MISDNTLYPLVEAEVKKAPPSPGVYMLWLGPHRMLEIAEADSLLDALLQAQEKSLKASHFSINTAHDDHASRQLFVEHVRKQWIARPLQSAGHDVA